jgi:hypothetical protein
MASVAHDLAKGWLVQGVSQQTDRNTDEHRPISQFLPIPITNPYQQLRVNMPSKSVTGLE